MMIFEVLNHFARSRYLVAAKTKEEMLEIIDKDFLKKLQEIKEAGEYFDEENDEYQYDSLRNSREERMAELSYKRIVEDATKSSIIVEKNLSHDSERFYY